MNKQDKEIIKEFMRKAGSKGGKSTVERHGKLYMSQLVKKRWAKRKTEPVDKPLDKSDQLV